MRLSGVSNSYLITLLFGLSGVFQASIERLYEVIKTPAPFNREPGQGSQDKACSHREISNALPAAGLLQAGRVART